MRHLLVVDNSPYQSYRLGPAFMWAVPPSREGKTARQYRAARRKYARTLRTTSRWNAAHRRASGP